MAAWAAEGSAQEAFPSPGLEIFTAVLRIQFGLGLPSLGLAQLRVLRFQFLIQDNAGFRVLLIGGFRVWGLGLRLGFHRPRSLLIFGLQEARGSMYPNSIYLRPKVPKDGLRPKYVQLGYAPSGTYMQCLRCCLACQGYVWWLRPLDSVMSGVQGHARIFVPRDW